MADAYIDGLKMLGRRELSEQQVRQRPPAALTLPQRKSALALPVLIGKRPRAGDYRAPLIQFADKRRGVLFLPAGFHAECHGLTANLADNIRPGATVSGQVFAILL